MNTQQKVIDTFSILHDGVIESWTGSKEKLTLKISCRYLAELLNKDFEYFYIVIDKIEKIQFSPWMNPINKKQKLFSELNDIFQAELEILSSEKKEADSLIVCNQHNTAFDFCGGDLTLRCGEIKIFDQQMKYLEIDKLEEICDQYWSGIKK